MAKDKQINLRVESKKMEWLHIEAKKHKLSISAMIIQIIDDIVSGNATQKDMKIEVLESELATLRIKFENQFNKKLPKTHRVSIALTDEEFLKLQKQSSKMKISNAGVLANMIRGKNNKSGKTPKALA